MKFHPIWNGFYSCMDVSIIIVNWNSKEYLRKCITSIQAETRGLEYEIIVIDSASYDGCDRMLREEFPAVRFIQSTTNLGFARSNNQAFAASRGKTVLLLNPDTELRGPAINKLHDSFWNLPNAGIVAPRVLNDDLSFQMSCVQTIPTVLNRMLDSEITRRRHFGSQRWSHAEFLNEDSPAVEVEAVSGACMMTSRELFLEVGGFSEDYFMYGEDVDLCCKVRQRGGRIYHIPQSVILHHGGGSSEKAPSSFSAVVMRESVWRFLRKFRGAGYATLYRVGMFSSALARLFVLIVILPYVLVTRRMNSWSCSVWKWMAILLWTLGISPVAAVRL